MFFTTTIRCKIYTILDIVYFFIIHLVKFTQVKYNYKIGGILNENFVEQLKNLATLIDSLKNSITTEEATLKVNLLGKTKDSTPLTETDKDEAEFLAFANNPTLQKLYKELPRSSEEARKVAKMWEIIKNSGK
ncbi:hypothetical protein [Lysinibacillus sphaericus]|uniref:hypothetical protein n=1 Tax=Lysinibacillus sphaericus TaxID=1421 RepID=UPI001CC09103|nr:hypothetical protein [Lysinibacillus sphaericus]